MEDGANPPDTTDVGAKPTSAKAPKPAKKAKAVKKKKKSQNKSVVTSESAAAEKGDKQKRRSALFPASSFGDALELAETIYRIGGGVKVRRLTVFSDLDRSPDSGASRQLITNSSRYGLTIGNYSSEHLELTPDGSTVVSPDSPEASRVRAKFRLAIEGVQPFRLLFEKFVDKRLPTPAVMADTLRETGMPEGELQECAQLFIINAKYVGVLKEIAGAERLIPIEHVVEELPRSAVSERVHSSVATDPAPTGNLDSKSADYWDKTCFYIAAIGGDGSPERKHSNLFLSAIVEPALEPLGFKVIRADAIDKPGMITSQVIEHILRCKMVVADLSFHNPNAFYELCLRHATRLPVVQIIRTTDRIPFDINQFRTVVIDETDKYTLIPKLDVYRAEIANQARRALEDPGSAASNPLITFAPSINLQYDGKPK